jgi:hypothetical protein
MIQTTQNTRRIEDESDLVSTLSKDIQNSDKSSIVFIAGHFPLMYRPETRTVEPSYSAAWGPFPIYSLEIAARLAEGAKAIGKECKLALVVDDHTYSGKEKIGQTVNKYWSKRKRDKFYKNFSGQDAKLPDEFGKIILAHGINLNNIIRFDHKKPSREDCLFASENILVAQRRARLGVNAEESECSKAYAEFIDSYFNKNNQYLVAFIPNRCTGNVCKGVLDRTSRIDASHVFCHTDDFFGEKGNSKLKIPDLYQDPQGIFYRKDTVERSQDKNENIYLQS